MNRKPPFRRKTAISYKTEEKTVLRGYNLSDLAEKGYSFCDAMFVMFQNRIPAEKEENMLKYEMGVFLEHSMSPSAVAAIGVSTGRPNLPTAGRFYYDLRRCPRPRRRTWLYDEQVHKTGTQRRKIAR